MGSMAIPFRVFIISMMVLAYAGLITSHEAVNSIFVHSINDIALFIPAVISDSNQGSDLSLGRATFDTFLLSLVAISSIVRAMYLSDCELELICNIILYGLLIMIAYTLSTFGIYLKKLSANSSYIRGDNFGVHLNNINFERISELASGAKLHVSEIATQKVRTYIGILSCACCVSYISENPSQS